MCDLYSHDSHFWSIIVSKQNSEHEWTVASAKAPLSEVISRAQQSPQTITRNGKASVVIVSIEEWQHKSQRQGSLATFLAQSPLAGAGLELERDNDRGRDLPL
ncbi:MAG: type II toxin-antitoxin system Phd/YefM family antitoxin [Mesorhizobium sp.]|nr:type II toxin-antitoxin system Phd/YefM family antitoxin [Mesorhizobium sp.]